MGNFKCSGVLFFGILAAATVTAIALILLKQFGLLGAAKMSIEAKAKDEIDNEKINLEHDEKLNLETDYTMIQQKMDKDGNKEKLSIWKHMESLEAKHELDEKDKKHEMKKNSIIAGITVGFLDIAVAITGCTITAVVFIKKYNMNEKKKNTTKENRDIEMTNMEDGDMKHDDANMTTNKNMPRGVPMEGLIKWKNAKDAKDEETVWI